MSTPRKPFSKTSPTTASAVPTSKIDWDDAAPMLAARKALLESKKWHRVAFRSLKEPWIACLVAWGMTLFVCEWVLFFWTIGTCRWPGGEKDTHALLISDVQLTDSYSYGMAQGSAVLFFTQLFSDLYLRKVFQIIQMLRGPQVVFNVGDMFDGGYVWDDQQYAEELDRYRWVFSLRSAGVRMHHISGNHDVGYGDRANTANMKRHVDAFGPTNAAITVANFTVVLLNSQHLDPSLDLRARKDTIDFVSSLDADKDSLNPRILMLHVPLYRPDNTPCGPLHTGEIINQNYHVNLRCTTAESGGDDCRDVVTFQNFVSRESTKWVLSAVRPVIVFGGHNHAYCEYRHPSGPLEISLGTLSWLQGTWYPRYDLLSLDGVSREYTLQSCGLPSQMLIYFWYLFMFAVTIAVTALGPRPHATMDSGALLSSAAAQRLRARRQPRNACVSFCCYLFFQVRWLPFLKVVVGVVSLYVLSTLVVVYM